MKCKNCNEEMTKITDHGKTGLLCLHCGSSFVPEGKDSDTIKESKPHSDKRKGLA